MLEPGKIIAFDRKKYFKYIRPLGAGGTGDTFLFKDETTDTFFAIKKYSPKGNNDIEDNYYRFVQEVKILFNISHANIVRIYNYYLYPETKSGYLQMEYIDGVPIDKFEPYKEKSWNEIFIDTINSFKYLEDRSILHRDIRPSNIIIDTNGNIKIIDFGFGKKLYSIKEAAGSIFLNWPVSEQPLEIINQHIYTAQSEIFFVGKLFSHINLESEFASFRFYHIIRKMTEIDPEKRYKNFDEILTNIYKNGFSDIEFDQVDRKTYQNFVYNLLDVIVSFNESLKMERDISKILERLHTIISVNILEEYIQNVAELLRVFMSHSYTYYINRSIEVQTVKDFYQLLLSLSQRKQQILLDNLHNRLSTIKIVPPEDIDDVPF